MTSSNFPVDHPIPFAGDPLDYAETHRSDPELQSYLEKSSARAMLLYKGKLGIGDGGRPHRVHPSELIGHNLFAPGPIFLGFDGERPLFAASVQNPTEFLPEENYVELRGIGGNLPPIDLAIAGRARSLFEWHHAHKFCFSCGGKLVGRAGGVKQQCTGCGIEHFPRINPVVIMLVTHGDSILLGRAPGWPEGFMSTLAGFISPGESLEEAAAREVLEEAGIKTRNVQYLFSQPWPYPSQLMIGVKTEAINTDITIDPKELEDARWFKRDQVLAVFEKRGDAFLRPPRATIAHQLLRYWLSETA